MKKYLLNQFPGKFKTYFYILVATLITIVVIDYFVIISYYANTLFIQIARNRPYLTFIITPLVFASTAYIIKYHCTEARGSGIPQLLGAQDSRNKSMRSNLLSIRTACNKAILVFVVMLGGGAIGVGGPSAHIGGSIFYYFNKFINLRRKLLIHALIAMGGSIGLIIAFNAPIAGFLFAYEELGRKLKTQALLFIAITCYISYLITQIYRKDYIYLTDISSNYYALSSLWQLLPLIIITGVLGGLFAKLLLYLISKFIANNKFKVIAIALLLGFVVATFNYLSLGQVSGSGKEQILSMLSGDKLGIEFIIMKYIAALVSLASTIPGGLFIPSMTIGASIGSEISLLFSQTNPQIIIIMAMIGYLSAVIRTPLTAVFIVLELTHSLNLLIPGMVMAFGANFISKKINIQPIYEALANKYIS